MKFHTRFETAACLNVNKEYDTHDNVDRVSYVDSTRLVQRFILEGHNLNAVRAKALRSGLYSGDLKEIENDDSIPIPVYQQDPAVFFPQIDDLKERIQARAAKNNDDSNDDKSLAAPPVADGSSDGSKSN